MRILSAFVALLLCLAPNAYAQNSGMAGIYKWREAVIRETPAKIGAAYVQVTNSTASEDALIGAKASWAGRVELHSTSADANGVMRMAPVTEITLPAKSAMLLAQGGYHIMLFDIKDGADINKRDITLTFRKAGDVVIPFQIQPLAVDPQYMLKEKLIMDHSGHDHMHTH